MTRIKSVIGKARKDGTMPVSIVISHNSVRKQIPTEISLTKSDIAKGRITNKDKRLMLDRIISSYKDRLYDLTLSRKGQRVAIEEIVNRLVGRSQEQLDFFQFADEWIKKSTLKYTEGHVSTLNSLEKFIGRRKLPFTEITYGFLTDYCNSLKGLQRAPSKHLGNIRQLFKEARLHYNTDTKVLIPNNPFERFKVPKDIPANKERSIDIPTLIKILQYKGTGLRGLARNCYVLSLFLIGMNSADLYNATDYSKGILRYKRTKTRTRRYDEAYIEIQVHDCLKPLFKKYKGTSRVFNFYSKYVNSHNFNKALNIGLKKMCKDIGIRQITFYSARHTWATIARNELGIDKGTISDALNHIDDSMAITDRYIKKDFSQINKANFKVIEFVLSESRKVL